MPLKYKKNGNTYVIYHYASLSDITGDYVHSHMVVKDENNSTRYIGLSTNFNHPYASDLRVKQGSTTYTVLSRSKQYKRTFDRTYSGSESFTVLYDVDLNYDLYGGGTSSQSGGGGGSGAAGWIEDSTSFGWELGQLGMAGGSGGSAGAPYASRNRRGRANTSRSLNAGTSYRFIIADHASSAAGGAPSNNFNFEYSTSSNHDSVKGLDGGDARTNQSPKSKFQYYNGSNWINITVTPTELGSDSMNQASTASVNNRGVVKGGKGGGGYWAGYSGEGHTCDGCGGSNSANGGSERVKDGSPKGGRGMKVAYHSSKRIVGFGNNRVSSSTTSKTAIEYTIGSQGGNSYAGTVSGAFYADYNEWIIGA